MAVLALLVPDGCEWSPDKGRAATSHCRHYLTTRAELIVGANGQWRLCRGCAGLPVFSRYRVRRPILARAAKKS